MKKHTFNRILFCAAFMILSSASLFAQSYYIKSACGKYLTVKDLSTTAGSPVVLSDFQASKAQQWNFIPRSKANGEYIFYIESAKSGKYLDVVWGKDADGTKIQLWHFTGGPAQEWTITTLEGTAFKGKSRFVSQVGGKNLDKGGGPCNNNSPIMIWTRNDTDAQMWYLEEVVPPRETLDLQAAPIKPINKQVMKKSLRN